MDHWKSDGDREDGGGVQLVGIFFHSLLTYFSFLHFPHPLPPPITFVMVRLLTGVCGVALLLRYFAVSYRKFDESFTKVS